MKRLILAAGLVAALGAAPAMAADTAIILWNGLATETATGFGSVDVTTSNLGGVTVLVSSGNRDTNPNGLDEANVLITNTDTTAQTLNIILGANGYLGPSDLFRLSGTINLNLGSADFVGDYFVDSSNSLNGLSEVITGTNINAFNSGLLTGPQAYSFNGFGSDAVAGPYGMAEFLSLTLQPGAQIGVTAMSMETAVPEIPAWAMILAGFGLLSYGRSTGLVGRKTGARLAA